MRKPRKSQNHLRRFPERSWMPKPYNRRLATQGSVRELAGGIFKPFHWSDRQEVRGQVIDRLVKAEISCRSGQHPPVSEENVVKVVNNLAQRIGAPDFVKTNLDQVRYLRVSLMMRAPHFVAAGARDQQGHEIPRAMSPVEGTYVLLSLIHQKLFNPKFQENGGNWLKNRHVEAVERWKKQGSEKERDSRPRLLSVSNPHAAAIHGIMVNASRLSFSENLADQALDDLGVSR
jgi:hypothetical protein